MTETRMDETRMDGTAAVRVAAVDDHVWIIDAIMASLRDRAEWLHYRGAFPFVDELLAGAGEVDVVLLDLDLGGVPDRELDPFEHVRQLRAAAGAPQVIVFTSIDNRPVKVRRAVQAGAAGLVLKGDGEQALLSAVRRAHAGELVESSSLAHALLTDHELAAHLAPKELAVFRLLAQGVGRTEVGGLLDPPVAQSSVDTYLRRVAAKYRDLGRPTYNSYETLRQVTLDGHVDLSREPVPRSDGPT